MDSRKKIDKRNNLRIVTENNLITAKGLPELSLNARKLLYVAMAQCKKNDTEFYEYETSPSELAEIWGIDRSNVYREADKITDELLKILVRIQKGEKGFKKRHLFETCDYDDDSVLTFKLHNEMTDLLLGVKESFSRPLLWDFMKMRSPYSMAIWHVFQKEMKSFKPMINSPIEFEVSLDELRQATGCENKLKQVGQFKERVLDKAIMEIRKNCLTDIFYTNIKRGRTVTGFRFTARSIVGDVDVEKMSYHTRQLVRKAILVNKLQEGTITMAERRELEDLRNELAQMTLEDAENGYQGD